MNPDAEKYLLGLEKLKAAIEKNRRLVLETHILMRQLDESLAASKGRRKERMTRKPSGRHNDGGFSETR
jgi:regulator of replication initiation timing